MEYIRALYGTSDQAKKNLVVNTLASSSVTETVYAWGADNVNFLSSSNIPYVEITGSARISKNTVDNSDYPLMAIKEAHKSHTEVMYLSWGIDQIKDIDDEYASILGSKGDIQCTSHSYPYTYETDVLNEWTTGPVEYREYITSQSAMISTHGYDWNSMYVMPSPSCIYSRSAFEFDILIQKAEEASTTAETFGTAMVKYAGYADVYDYFDNHEISVATGTPSWKFDQESINSYFSIYKSIYFKHRDELIFG